MIQLLNSCPNLFRSTSFRKSSFRSRSYRLHRSRGCKYSSCKKLSRFTGSSRLEDYTSSIELQSPGTTDSSFTLLATLQLSVSAFGPEFSYIDTSTVKSKLPSSQLAPPSFENNPPNLRKQGRLALTFALRKYNDISNEERIALANDIEEAIDRIYVGSQYREGIYFVGGLLAEEEEIVVKLVNKETTIEDVLIWSVKSGSSEYER